ncbi:MAG TPA: aquaporin [Candidatus Saccharimonadales bacterium]|nr:aquaporin [Candidatus Saccharimonadales bacterium]
MLEKRKVAALGAEFLGTGILTLMILSVQRSTVGVPFFVAAGAGLALAVVTYALHEASGAHFNPALTFANWVARKVSTVTGALYIVAQLLGAWAAYWLYTYYVGSSFQPIGSNFAGRVLVAELVGTAVFSLAVAASAARRNASGSISFGGIAAFTGVAYMLGIVAASPASIGLLNPAVALGVRAWVPWGTGVTGWGTYVLGSVLGAVIGTLIYLVLFSNEPVTVAAKASPAKKAVAKPAARKRAPARRKK